VIGSDGIGKTHLSDENDSKITFIFFISLTLVESLAQTKNDQKDK